MLRDDNQETAALRRATTKILRESSAATAPPVVYHYTSLETSIKILNSFELWCTNVLFSNDPSEGRYGESVIGSVCTRDPDLLLEGARKLIADEIEGYTTSFCAMPDELTQWRAYGMNGRGVAIGVDTEVLASRSNVAFSHVAYDPARQEKLVKDILNLYRGRMLSAKSWRPRLRRLASVLTQSFVIVRAMLKDPSYHAEQEYRLLDALPKDPRRHDTNLEHFDRGSRSVPFFRVDLRASSASGAAQPFREVWVGPCVEFSSAQEELRQTTVYKAKAFDITRSRVPMRCD